MLFCSHVVKEKELHLIEAIKLQPVNNQANPMVCKLEFWKRDVFKKASDLIERPDQVCVKRLSTSLCLPHGRIRLKKIIITYLV